MWIKASDYSTETCFHVSASERTNFKTGDQKVYVSAPKHLFSITKDLQTLIKQPSSFIFQSQTSFVSSIIVCKLIFVYFYMIRSHHGYDPIL